MLHVLIADDDPIVRTVIERIIQRLFHAATVTAVDNGTQALTVLQSVPTDLVITDDHMPGLSGRDLIALACTCGLTMPIILMSGQDETIRMLTHIEQVRGMLKPFTIDELAAVVRGLLPHL